MPAHMYTVKLPIVNQEKCVTAYEDYNTSVTTNMICAGLFETGGVGSCDHDTGGPLVVDGILVGITSWSYGCARPKFPSVFTKVSMYRSWIDWITQTYPGNVLN